MNDTLSLYGSGPFSVPAEKVMSTIAGPCEDSQEHWYCAAVWTNTKETTGQGVTFGIGLDTAALVAYPSYGVGFVSIPAADISVGYPKDTNPATAVSFYGQIPPGLSLVVASDLDVGVNVMVWRVARKIQG